MGTSSALSKEVVMTNRNGFNGDGEDSIVIDTNECESERNCTQFCVEIEETINDKERERLCKDAKKYEELIDRLFDENEDQCFDNN